MSAWRGGSLYLAEGAPALASVLLNAARSEMRGDGTGGATIDRAAQIKQLEAMLGDGALAGAGASSQFDEFAELARLYDGVGNYAGAEQAWRRALEVQMAALGPEHPGVGETLANLALAVSNEGRADEAELLFQRAEPLVRRSADPSDLPRFQSYLALQAANQRQFARALGIMREVTDARRELATQFGGDDAPDPSGLGNSRTILGDGVAMRAELAHGLMFEAAMALQLDDVSSAEAAVNEARRIVDAARGLPPWWRPRILALVGEVEARKGRPQEAERAFVDSANARRAIFGSSWSAAEGFFDLGRFRSNDGRYGPSLAAYRTAFGMIDTDSTTRPEIRFQRLAPFMEAAIGFGEQNPAQRPALAREMFRVSQLAREGAASQTIARASARVASDDPRLAALTREAQEAARERDRVRLDLSAETAKPRDQRDAAVETALIARGAAAERKANELEKQLQVAFPAYASMTAPAPVEAAALGSVLADDEAFVSYAFGADSGYAFLVRKGVAAAFRIELGEEEVSDAVAELRRAFDLTGGVPAPFNLAASHALYRKLLQPLEESLEGVKRLIVSPQGALLSLPPALLVTEPPRAANDYSGAAWLARRMAVTVTPSPRAFMALKELEKRPVAPKPFIGYGAPNFSGPANRGGGDASLASLGRECRTGGPMPTALLRALAPLPETADELRRVAALLGAGADDIRVGRDASEQDVRGRAMDQYRVVYFATHGLLPGELRCQSEPGLALSPPDTAPKGVEDDGLLDASAIASLKLSADLVVLSACNTGGAGGKFGGESLSGLAEAFFYAGARSLLVTHWEVPSQPTVALMTGLFERLARQAGAPAEALRQSQMALASASATAHPFYWAAFQTVGGGGDFAAGPRASAGGNGQGSGA